MRKEQDFKDKGSNYTMANKSIDWIKLLTHISNSIKTRV